MYYIKIIKKPGIKGPDGKYKFKSSRIPIDKKTFDLLYNSMFMWWSPGLAKDIDNEKVENVIQDTISLNTFNERKNFETVLIPEINNGQLIKIIRDKYFVDAKGYNKMMGIPITKQELTDAINQYL